MLVVDGVGGGGVNQPTHQPTNPVTTHSPTNNPYPPTHTHVDTTEGFFADTHHVTVKEAIVGLMLEYRTNEITVNAIA